ncbi:SOS response-associated peptidase family protein [Stakelama flava]|uniref:SOS response-associated peptidase family protein n=1 Tax=Stakelama flava TaxID=2860338 RepID=UPI003CCE7747
MPKKGDGQLKEHANNTCIDKLDSFFWRDSFEERRCLIPLTHFAKAEGPKGAKTRTWFSAPGEDGLLVAASIWRSSDEWGECYSMIMTKANESVAGA